VARPIPGSLFCDYPKHGAPFCRFHLQWAKAHPVPATVKIEAAKKWLHRNVLAIALANKLARIAWSVLARGRNFEATKFGEAAEAIN
jgi:hypothetical protein